MLMKRTRSRLNILIYLVAIASVSTLTINSGVALSGQAVEESPIDTGYLSQTFKTIALGQAGDYGAYFSVMETGEEAGYQQDKPFVAASCYKLFLVMYLYEKAAVGEIDLEQKIIYSSGDYSDGTGIIQFMPRGTAFTVRQLCRLAITHSDNIAANMLRRTFGYMNYRAYAGSIACPVSSRTDGSNLTTARELGTVLRRIQYFAAESPLGQEVIDFLKADIYRSRIPAGVPSGVSVGNKVGDYEGYMNDAAIVFAGDITYILVVLSSGAAGDNGHVRFSSRSYAYVSSLLCTGGHCLAGATAPAREWYFAEGYTGDGFQEWLCIQNPGVETATVRLTYYTQEVGALPAREFYVPAQSRLTIDVNSDAGPDRQLAASLRVTAGPAILVERPMYFRYRDIWTGGHVALGASAPDREWYFAEGYTGPGFEEWITVFNPGDEAASLTFRFQTQESGEVIKAGKTAPPRSRASFLVNDLLGPNFQVSLGLESSAPVVAERSMYFDYTGKGAHQWTGGHCVVGANAPANRYYFAEGTSREGFEEWLTLQNPSPNTITVTATYCFNSGSLKPLVKAYRIEGGRRATIFVPEEVGAGLDVSVILESPDLFAAERPMYFFYTGYGARWSGGHCISGIPAPASEAYFAEGYTGPGFHEWLCLLNPGDTDALIEISYYTQESGPLPAKIETIPAKSRKTIMVNEHAGPDYQLSTRIKVTSGPGIVAERPMYFNYNSGNRGL